MVCFVVQKEGGYELKNLDGLGQGGWNAGWERKVIYKLYESMAIALPIEIPKINTRSK